MKNFLLLLISLLFIAGCSTANIPETNEKQMKRLLKEAEKKEKEMKNEKKITIKTEENEEQNLEEIETDITEVVEINAEEEWIDPHKGKTKGEIMIYEMGKIDTEMKAIQMLVNDHTQKSKVLKEYREKLEKLGKLNQASMK